MLLHLIRLALILTLASTASALRAEPLPALTFAGLPVLETAALIEILEDGALASAAERIEFVPWNNPDQARALLVSGQVDVAVIPSSMAAALYTKGLPVRLLFVTEARGLLSILSAREGLTDLPSLRGERIAIPFRGDMPDLVFSGLLRTAGLDPQDDVERVYTSSPVEAVQLLLSGRIDHAFLAEPMTTLAEIRAGRNSDADLPDRRFFRFEGLEKMWAEAAPAGKGPFLAAMVVNGQRASSRALLSSLQQAYRAAYERVRSDPDLAAQRLSSRFPQLRAQIMASAFERLSNRLVAVSEERAAIRGFFAQLLAENAAALGGMLPDDGIFLDARP